MCVSKAKIYEIRGILSKYFIVCLLGHYIVYRLISFKITVNVSISKEFVGEMKWQEKLFFFVTIFKILNQFFYKNFDISLLSIYFLQNA